MSAVYRVVLDSCDFSLSLVGSTGVGKSELAALIQQHFGPRFDSRNLPASWYSTENANEMLAFKAANAILTIDDFAPHGSSADISRYHQKADRLFRGQGNAAGRARMRSDGTLRPPKPPRGLILSTGEDFPQGQSIQARQLILEVAKGDVDFHSGLLTQLQQQAGDGLFAAALAGYLNWALPNLDAIRQSMKQRIPEIRIEATMAQQHARLPGIIANLTYGFRLFVTFAKKIGAITEAEQQQLKDECWHALLQAGGLQQSHQQTSDPVKFFLSLLHSALGTGRVHLAGIKGDSPPAHAESYGWTKHPQTGNCMLLKPSSPRVGWRDEHYIYLDRDAVFAEMQSYRQEQGKTIPITAEKLWRALKEQNLLAEVDEARSTLTVRKQIQGTRRAVLCLLPQALEASTEDALEAAETLDEKLVDSLEPPADESTSDALPSAETVNGHASPVVVSKSGRVRAAKEASWASDGQVEKCNPTTKNTVNSSVNQKVVGMVGFHEPRGDVELEEYKF